MDTRSSQDTIIVSWPGEISNYVYATFKNERIENNTNGGSLYKCDNLIISLAMAYAEIQRSKRPFELKGFEKILRRTDIFKFPRVCHIAFIDVNLEGRNISLIKVISMFQRQYQILSNTIQDKNPVVDSFINSLFFLLLDV